MKNYSTELKDKTVKQETFWHKNVRQKLMYEKIIKNTL